MIKKLSPLLLLLTVACTTPAPAPAPEPECASLPGALRYCLQPTGALPAFGVQQKVVATFRGKRETLITDIENDASQMRFVALTPFGQTLLQMSYDNRQASTQLTLSKRISAPLVMGLLQVALWPAADVQRGLGSSATVEDSATASNITRSIMRDGELLMQVQHDASAPPYQHQRITIPSLDITLEIDTLKAPTSAEGARP